MHGYGWISGVALACYMAAEGFSIAHLRKDKPWMGTVTSFLLMAGFVIQFIGLELGGRAAHTVPYHDLPSSMSLFAWMVVGAYGVLRLIHRESATGPFLIPIALVFHSASLLAHPGPASVADPRFTGPLFALHVTIAIFGYAGLTLSFVLAQLYLIQTRQLHRRKLGLLFSRLPALDVIWRLHTFAISLGLAALALATSFGLIWAKRNWGTYWDAKVASTFLVLAVYLFTLFAPRLGLSEKKTAWASIFGFLLVLFSYTIVNLFLTAEHVFR